MQRAAAWSRCEALQFDGEDERSVLDVAPTAAGPDSHWLTAGEHGADGDGWPL